ncbi:hypothetical protein GYMLUDRAFT_49749 [Collybiopsis luxurians FD-317 M1]|uniref:Flavin-containing monooxygenase n=1 Tax=Collybiopsis luxurians FD-317 M1 TaxID=944289 RepID=A0A0D0AR04_9AGAR|nr:hypothetical protein GYMLUDRAFT_49749 [Collybiopsis luxurians FD-317 M1]
MNTSKSSNWQSRIPTLNKLGVEHLGDIDELQVTKNWFQAFLSFVSGGNTEGIIGLFCDDALWRDMLSMTWDMRTFDGCARISKFLAARLPSLKMTGFKLGDFVQLQKPYPDLAWIVATFEFETTFGVCSGVFRLIPTAQGPWKAYTMFTMLESLKAYPEKAGATRDCRQLTGGQWREERENEIEFKDRDPAVLIVGAGQSGLQLAARLKFLDIPALMIEKHARVGDTWRKRYDSLSLHSPVWNDHMAYIPFPPTWPKYTPSLKMADWLENYARILDLNIWLSSMVLGATLDSDKKWNVHVKKSDGSERIFKVNQLVIATGFGDGTPNMPQIPNLEYFHGIVLHSVDYKQAADYKEKKIVVIGAGTAGHDIASDLVRNGADVTMYQRSSTFVTNLDLGWKFMDPLYTEGGLPIEIADRLSHSIPHLLLEGGMAQRATQAMLDSQNEHLKRLEEAGFQLNKGIKDAGLLLQLKERFGGFYLDNGGSQFIIDKKIKLKNGTQIKAYDSEGLVFEDGSRVSADVVIYATGFGDMRNSIRKICGDAVADLCPSFHGVNEEGEMNWYRPLSDKNLWMMVGPLQLNRFYSKYLALHLQALEKQIIC